MRRSFYTWLMTQRNAKSQEPLAVFADLAFEDSTFPKHATEFEELSSYLEEGHLDFNLSEFDRIWELYLEH